MPTLLWAVRAQDVHSTGIEGALHLWLCLGRCPCTSRWLSCRSCTAGTRSRTLCLSLAQGLLLLPLLCALVHVAEDEVFAAELHGLHQVVRAA